MDSSTAAYEHNEETVRFIQQLVHTDGKLSSPINLNISDMKIVELNPVQWFNYNVLPKKLKLTNTGHTVILSAIWHGERPYLHSGPYVDNYVFSQIHFHWGPTDMYGSEHYVDDGSMPMELHAVHFKSDYETQDVAVRKDDGITVLVYFFQATPNPLLNDVINTLSIVQEAHSSVRLVPFPILNIIQCFQRDYFLYWGSITLTNLRNSILWLVSRQPLGISVEQVATFRTLCDERQMPILSNTHPLREKGNRTVFHVCPSGSRYATLLPIPRDPRHMCTDDQIDIDANDAQQGKDNR